MNAKHTPGPWAVGHEMNSERPGSVPVVAMVRDSLGGKMHVAFVNGMAGEQEANARLIAAAPDLLRALMAIVENADKGFSVTTWTGLDGIADAGTVANVDAARAAIARATGGAS